MEGSASDILILGGNAFVIALTGAMAPGPLLTVTITETVRRGWRSALLLLAGHALLEAGLLAGFAFGLQDFLSSPAVADALAILGGLFLVWMGADLLAKTIRKKISLDLSADDSPPRFGPVAQGALVSISNPYWTLWWVTVGVKLASDGLAMGPAGVASFFAGHELADLAWYALVIAAVSRGRKFAGDRVYRTILGVCAAFLIYLGSSFVLSAM